MFFSAWAFILPSILLRLPYSALEAFVFSCITYYVIGFAANPGRCACKCKLIGQLSLPACKLRACRA